MKTEIMIAVLALLCIGSMAAAFVLWAKVDEQKQKTKEEHECYEAMRRMYSGLTALAQEKDAQIEEERELRMCCERKAEFWFDTTEAVVNERDALQDKLSAILCPHNDHVWEVSDAYRGECRCKKCGRVKDA